MTKESIDPKAYDLYDKYCHTEMTRRDLLWRVFYRFHRTG